MTKQHVEVITSVERRRRWSRDEKERLVAACLEPEASVSEIARSVGIHVSPLFRWRKELCQISAPSVRQFVPVEVVAALPAPDPVEPTPPWPRSMPPVNTAAGQVLNLLTHIADTPIRRLEQLLPWNWMSTPTKAVAA